MSLIGGEVSGSSNSNASQSATLTFIPSANINEESAPVPLTAPFPSDQGLASINSAWAGSAAFNPYTYSTTTTSTATPASTRSGSSSLTTTWLLLAALAAGAWLMFHGGKL